MKAKYSWTKESCYNVAKQFSTKSEFAKKNPVAYGVSLRNGWLCEFDCFKQSKPNGYWTEEKCREVALKCKTRSELYRKYGSAYEYARKNKWLNDYTWFECGLQMSADRKRKWTEQTCREAALKCKTRTEFSKKYNAAYNWSRIKGWLNDYTWFINGYKK